MTVSTAPKREMPAEPSPPGPAPLPKPRNLRRRRVLAGVFASAAGLSALVVLAAAYAVPDTLAFAAPLAVLLGGMALWATARVDNMRLAAALAEAEGENRRLAASLEMLADRTWELRDREERYRTLIEARQKAEAANLSKSRFLATVSHEFRTPLNGILGLNGLLLETPLTPDQETYARAVQSSGEALLALVDDILDFSKIEAGRLDLRPEPANLETLIEEIVELLAARAQGKGIDLAADSSADLPLVSVDVARLRQVLLNLAGNGVKFTETGGVRVGARLEATGPEKVRVRFTVADTGPGIAADEIERIFGEFEQGDMALSRRHGGAGLGLAISRRIVRRMGSDISVAPGPSGGSVFAFTLELPAASAPARTAGDLAGRRVLLLALNGPEAEVTATQLTAAGAEVRFVANANEAAALAGAATAAGLPYDAVLVDRRVGGDAAAILARLRQGAGRPLPAAILIEPGRRGEVADLKRAGYDAYLVRPVRRASLRKIVSEIAAAHGEFHADPTDQRPPRPAIDRRASASLNVLLAEDNEINALLVRAVLEQFGHVVTEVHDGAAAVAAAREGGFAFIFLDLHMPKLDGIAAARAIRSDEARTGAAPARIVALTADVVAETREAARAAGIDAVVEKPVAPDRLRQILSEARAA
ncbi:MAG TPA: ATP-binding protein [Bauldia sp.]|nr:ATP-binding protein [Bauldia sp.]